MFAIFNSDVPAAHLVCYSSRCAGTEKAVKNDVTGAGPCLKDGTYQPFRLGKREFRFKPEESNAFVGSVLSEVTLNDCHGLCRTLLPGIIS